MMKNNKSIRLIAIIYISLWLVTGIYTVVPYISNTNKSFIVKNNNTRNYAYEHYCDSIYETNPDYYLDVLVETDEFQSYLDEHGEWWTN